MFRAVVLLGLLGACFVDRASEKLECSGPADCGPGRTCTDGYCLPRPCPAPCTSCTGLDTMTPACTIDCGVSACSGTVTCPTDFVCNVQCDAGCDRVDCSAAASCDITCNGGNACGSGVACGAGPCSVACTGNGACDAGVTCGSSCSCDVSCGNNTCTTAATCPAGTSCDTGSGCTSAPAACNTCP